MESKRKNVYITIFVIATIAVSCLAVYFKFMGDKEVNDLQAQIESQKVEIENIKNEINSKKDNVQEEQDVTTDEEKTTQTITVTNKLSQENIDKIAKTTIDYYFKLTNWMFAEDGSELGRGYPDIGLYFENANVKYYGEESIYKTNIKYEEFITKIEKYMTRDLFERKYLNYYYKNIDGYVASKARGASGFGTYIEKVELISKNLDYYEYKVTYRTLGLGGQLSESNNVNFKLKEVNGNYVVSDENYWNSQKNPEYVE